MAADLHIDDREWRRLERRMADATRASVKVGILQGKGAEETDDDGVTMVEIGAIHEFGAPKANIRERSWLRRTFINRERDLAAVQAKLAGAVVRGEMSIRKALDLLGSWGATETKKTIAFGAHIPPPLKPATVEAKGSDRPLVDTGQLVASITWEVEE